MFFYNSFGPNPRALRMFLAEKGLTVEAKDIDLLAGDNRKPPYTDKNPGGQVPALDLGDGTVIGETVAIFEYIEELHPQPVLIGSTAKERAETRMWQRRIEQRISDNLYTAFRFAEGLELFKTRMRCLPEAAPGLKATVRDNLAWLDGLLGDRPFVVDGRFTIADIILYCALDFGASVGQPLPDGVKRVQAWFARVAARPSATASLHPAAEQLGMRG
jgi:glutathione S-transferase